MTQNEKNKQQSLDKIGERIRAVRIKQRMTQNQLAGGDITRNMISRIENGAALPSLPTLCAIASRLGVPAGALMGDLGDYADWHIAKELEALLNAEKFEELIETCQRLEYSVGGTLIADILCKAHIRYARKLYSEGKLSAALASLEGAEAINTQKLGSDKTHAEEIFICRRLILACPTRDNAESRNELSDFSDELASRIFKSHDAIYLYSLSRLSDISGVAYSVPHESAAALRSELSLLLSKLDNRLYRVHIDAKLDMISAEYLDAKAKLLTVLSPEVPPAVLYDIYADLEFCCKCCGDFENAYKYSGLRLELIQQMN